MANGIKIGNLDISAFKVGSADCKVYLGDTLLYPTTPSFQGKWLATYTGGTTSSADCDASSAITENEITLSNLVSVQIGDCVTSIGYRALYKCYSLTSVTIPNSVTTIGNKAFERCFDLTSITIPDSVTSIGGSAFYGCSGLTSIDIPSGVTSIGDSTFSGCTSLTSIDIPDSVTTIDYYAFERCTSLTSVTIGTGITRIYEDAFRYCSGLTSITVNATTPPTLETYSVFGSTNNCPIYVPCESVETYKTTGHWYTYASRITCVSPAFQGKWIATYVGGTTSSAECDSSSAITQYEINLTDLETVEIGDCVTSIDVRAFYNCGSLTSIDIPNSVTSINDFAFLYSNGFTSIVIPDSVTSIGIGAFYQCYGLTSITVNATTPPTLGFRAFDDTNNCPIYVPSGSVSAYQSASGWSDYASRITAIPT